MTYPTYLMHYGVKGQHWGERLYQNSDGTYTELGKERRRIGPHDYGSKKEKTPQEIANKIKNMDILTERNYDKYYRYSDSKSSFVFDYKKADNKEKIRLQKAVDNGLKALDSLDRSRNIDPDPIDDNKRRWFIFEDSTIGLITISDMVNQGYSKKEIVDIINEAGELPYDYAYDDKIFQLRENSRERMGKYYNEKFIDECIKLRDEEKLKHTLNLKISEIF